MTDAPAQSPYLPGTNIQFAWDSTSLGMLKTCPRLYQYVMIEGYQSTEESVHLRFGIEYHKCLEGYAKARAEGMSHKKAMYHTLGELISRVYDWNVNMSTPAGNYKNKFTLISLCIDYLDLYMDDAAKTYIKADGKPAVELSFRFELDWGPKGAKFEKDIPHGNPAFSGQPYLLCGHLDRVVTFSGATFVMDHKTSKTALGEYYFDQYAPNNQMTLYTIAGQLVLGSPIKGVIINGAQILLEKPNVFKRGMTYRTQEQLDEWLADLRFWFSTAEHYATTNYWPMNDTSCDKFGGCRFREVCSKSPNVRHTWLKNFHKAPPEDRWNPLKER